MKNIKWYFHGKIDRIDIAKIDDKNYVRIIDYKSSNKEIKLSNVYYGAQLQLLTYADAVTNDSLNLRRSFLSQIR